MRTNKGSKRSTMKFKSLMALGRPWSYRIPGPPTAGYVAVIICLVPGHFRMDSTHFLKFHF